ncbi:hypothetical protein [Rhodococcus sp. MEB064]|uniref:hypothetical protein n=1 Tax=Rhodococcus sp. MEB064 TaxID=1587522 RepID=UPI0005AC8757|nr:hypothetical protein [Rhodococcus sp. MEB064]KIQ15342.1 membrane protein [Rhodococcus sp. MEB064]
MLGTRLTAASTGILQGTVGILYLPSLPESLIRRPLMPGQVSAVVYIESIGPLWSVVFALSTAMLIASAVRGHGFIAAHIGSAGLWALYGSCILYSAFVTEPPVPVVAGTIASGVAFIQLSIAIGCRDRGHR